MISAIELQVLQAVASLNEATVSRIHRACQMAYSEDVTRRVLKRMVDQYGWVKVFALKRSGCVNVYRLTERGKHAVQNASLEGWHDLGLRDALSILDRITRDRLRAKTGDLGNSIHSRARSSGAPGSVERR